MGDAERQECIEKNYLYALIACAVEIDFVEFYYFAKKESNHYDYSP